MKTDSPASPPSIVPYLKQDEAGPYLSGVRCGACGHTYVGERFVCAQCGARNRMETVRLAETGKLYVYTIVHRSFPGVAVPFVDVIVDLDGGAHLKGTLKGVAPNPDAISFDMRVKVVYGEAEPANAQGQPRLTYFFVPA